MSVVMGDGILPNESEYFEMIEDIEDTFGPISDEEIDSLGASIVAYKPRKESETFYI